MENECNETAVPALGTAHRTKNDLARLSKDDPVPMAAGEICNYLNSNIGDVMKFIPDVAKGGRNE